MAQQITGKTVYILGAGASAHTGAPLLRDFLVKARLLLESRGKLTFQDSFKQIFTWVDSLRASSYYVEFDLDNLEHIFSLADMGRQLGFKKEKKIFSALLDVIAETLDQCELSINESKKHMPDDTYSIFIKTLFKLNQERAGLINIHSSKLETDTIITFNYDAFLDHAMVNSRVAKPYYHLQPDSLTESFSLLKLHGSVNWALCPTCKDVKVIPADLGPVWTVDSDILRAPFRMVTLAMKDEVCEKDHKPKSRKPLLIPPTWSKAIGKTAVAQVWTEAVKAIQEAFQIIIAGYSMPLTDTFFQYLLTLGLRTNKTLNRIIVVNSDKSDDFKNRYKRVFSRSLDYRGRLLFIPLTFKEFTEVGGYPEDKERQDSVVKAAMKQVGSFL